MKARAKGTPSLDPDRYDPLSSPQFIHPSLIVWQWRHGLLDLPAAVDGFVTWSVIQAARVAPGKKCTYSLRYIAERLGARTVAGQDDYTPTRDAVWNCVTRSSVLRRTGTCRKWSRQRAWDVGGVIEWEEGSDRYVAFKMTAVVRSGRPQDCVQDGRTLRSERPHTTSEECAKGIMKSVLKAETEDNTDKTDSSSCTLHTAPPAEVSGISAEDEEGIHRLVQADDLLCRIRMGIRRRWPRTERLLYPVGGLDRDIARETIEEFKIDGGRLEKDVDGWLGWLDSPDRLNYPGPADLTAKAFKVYLLRTLKGIELPQGRRRSRNGVPVDMEALVPYPGYERPSRPSEGVTEAPPWDSTEIQGPVRSRRRRKDTGVVPQGGWINMNETYADSRTWSDQPTSARAHLRIVTVLDGQSMEGRPPCRP